MASPKEAIAIIGMGCRYPGAPDILSLWRLLRDGQSAVNEIPAERFGPVEDFYDPRAATPGRLMSRYGGFLDDIERFDADFFGIAPLEARQLDPQQRILMEVAWEAIEDAGIPAGSLAGTSAGVFIGSWLQDFETRLIGDPLSDDLRNIDLYTTTGSGRYPLSGRLSYFFGLQGPSLVVDTACSSSLVAIHLACRSLLQGESEIALAGGVNILLTPYITVAYSQSRMMAPDGRCKFGDAQADGYVRSEGCGVVVLKPLARALADGDAIYAVIRGSAVNNDGRTSGYLTTPGGAGQEDLLRKAYGDAGIAPNQVQYVEAHGTGTLAGDPVELGALGTVLSAGRAAQNPCWVGSIKTNLGHTEGAAGVAGLIKTALAIKNREIPASLNFTEPNPNISWEDLGLKIPTRLTPWQSNGGPLTAGVSAFGITGTNAHIVLGEAPASDEPVDRPAAPGRLADRWIFPLSAHSGEALRAMARKIHARIAPDAPSASLEDLCATAARNREHLDYRLAVVTGDMAGLRAGLAAVAEGGEEPSLVFGGERIRPRSKLAFVYPGQGSQWLGMCRQLMRCSQVFREAMARCEEALQPYVDWSLRGQLAADGVDSRLDDISVVQPMLFAIQVALTEQWRSWGVTPDAVIGHSMGEPAAAHVSGVLSLDAAAKIITTRSRLMKRTSGQGAMAVVELTMEQAAAELEGRRTSLSIAVSNSPRSTVLSGDPGALDELLGELERRQVFCRKINVDVASHSPQMEPLRGELVAALDGMVAQPARVPIYSTVAGRILEGKAFEAAYWGDNLCRPVRFSETIARMLADGTTLFIEMSPHPVLLRAIDECAQADATEAGGQCVTLPSLLRKKDEPATMLTSLGRLYGLGHSIDWGGLYGQPVQRAALPTYAWQRERHWFEEAGGRSRSRRHSGGGRDDRPYHALLERHISSSVHAGLDLWESDLSLERLPWLADHTVQGHAIFPAAAFIEMAAAAAQEASGEVVELQDFEFHEALFVDRSDAKHLQVAMTNDASGEWEIRILSRMSGAKGRGRDWREHVRGKAAPLTASSVAPAPDVEAIRQRCDRLISGDHHYAAMQRMQIGYGPAFRSIERIGQNETEAVARIRAPQVIAADGHDFRIHPALLDAGLQLLVSLARREEDDNVQTASWMPVRLGKARVLASLPAAGELWAVAMARGGAPGKSGRFTGDLFLLDREGRLLCETRDVVLQRVGYTLGEDVDQWLFEMEWHPRPLAAQSSDGPGWMPGPDEVQDRVMAAPLPEILQRDAETAAELLPRIEALSIDYIVAALDRLGLRFELDRPFACDELAQRLHIQDRHRRLVKRLLSFLQEEGLIERSDGAWRFVRPINPRPCREIEERLLSQYPQCHPELSLLRRCGGQLAEALTGAADPLELLFPGGSLEEAERFYRDSVFARTVIHQAGQSLQAVIERLPIGRQLKILEVGAGTGGLTSHLLPLLPAHRTRYVFTDIGAAFVEQARKKYAAFDGMAYEVLDIEKDPMAQGFEPNSFDIVVAANCLHATRDMGATLSNVHKLLSPGGLMLLVEGMHDPRWIDLIFGLTEGWWMFEDIQRRPHQPLLNAAAWKSVAAESGFTDVAVFGQAKAALFDQAIVAARVPLAADGAHPAPDKVAWLIFADRGGVGEALGHDLRERGDDCRLVYKQADHQSGGTGQGSIDAANPAHFAQVLREFEDLEATGRRAVVYLWPLDDEIAGPQTVHHLRDAQEELCGGLLLLAKTLAGSPGGRRHPLWVISRRSLPTGTEDRTLGLAAAALSGLVKVIDLEHPELNCRQVDVDLKDDDAARTAEVLLAEFAADEGETQIVYREDNRWVPRVIRHGAAQRAERDWLALPEDRPARLSSENRGTLDGLKIRPVRYTPPGPGEVAIQVRATGLNFRDVVCALGLIADNDDPGLECAGQIVEVGEGVADFAVGDAVIAMSPGAFSTFVVAKAALVVPKPAMMTFEQAATIPIAFLTAYHGLVQLADLRPNEKVLIHAASGGVGLAAVQLAKACGAQIFGTAGSRTKRAYLESIGVDHVLYSRSLAFADRILDITAGEGVDVVLNSLSGDFIPRSFSVLRKKGRFIEIGKRDVWTREKVSEIRPDAFYATFDLAAMMAEQPEMLQPTMATLMEKFNAGELTPLPASIVPMEQVVRAYHTMQQARHIGKIVVNQQPWSGGRPIDAPDAFSSRGTYLITGGCGGIGLKLVQWLFERGARHFALIGRSKPSTDVAARISDLEGAGANIRLAQCDVASQSQTEQLFEKTLPSMPPLRGVFHLAGALDDGALIHQSWPRFEKVLAPKVLGGWNLHCLTRQLALDCFVMFSSWSSFLGSQGQANHSAANAFLDALAWQRRAEGLPALSINWGAWAEIGAATKGDAAEHLRRRGIGSFSPEMGLRALGRLMSQGAVQVAVTPFDLAMWRKSSPAAHRSRWFARLDIDAQAAQEELDGQVPTAADQPLGEMLGAAASESERRQVLDTFLKAQVAQTLRLPLARIDANKPFKSYGMDSLTALEFRNRIELATGLSLSATLVFNYPTIRQLQDFLLEKLADQTHGPADDADGTEADKPTTTPTEEEMRALLDEVEALSEEDARGLIDDEH